MSDDIAALIARLRNTAAGSGEAARQDMRLHDEAADAIRALQADNDKHLRYYAKCVVTMVPFIPAFGWLHEAIKQLGDERNALQADAARYRWLRRNQCWPDRELDRLRDETNATNAELLDAAIDASIGDSCRHDWVEMRSDADPYRDDECRFCHVAKAEAMK